MKRSLLLITNLALTIAVFSQQQIGNGDFESWETVSDELHEPVNWNSFQTASGNWGSFGGQQMDWSTSVRPGSTGTKSVWIWSNSILGEIANGNVTLGQINMGSTTPADASNYNYSKTPDAAFSEPLTDTPDSIVFWVKYTPISGSSQARVSSVLHDNYNFKDPNEVNDGIHCVATAILNFGTTNGLWVRKAVPFTYTGITATNTHILATFTTNMTPGGGNDNDQVWIDDVQLIYNPVNQAVVANDDVAFTFEDTPVDISVLDNDIDPENDFDVSSLNINTNPTNGIVNVNTITGVITYSPNAGYFGADSFEYEICDNGTPVLCDIALVNITISEVIAGNNPIIANDDVAVTEMDTPVITNVLANDVDYENQIDFSTLTVTIQPTNGITAVNTLTGEITYTPNTGYFGYDSYMYSICDAGTPAITCDEAEVDVTVNLNWAVSELSDPEILVFATGNEISIVGKDLNGVYSIFSTNGGIVQTGKIQPTVILENAKGIYFVHLNTSIGVITKKIVIL